MRSKAGFKLRMLSIVIVNEQGPFLLPPSIVVSFPCECSMYDVCRVQEKHRRKRLREKERTRRTTEDEGDDDGEGDEGVRLANPQPEGEGHEQSDDNAAEGSDDMEINDGKEDEIDLNEDEDTAPTRSQSQSRSNARVGKKRARPDDDTDAESALEPTRKQRKPNGKTAQGTRPDDLASQEQLALALLSGSPTQSVSRLQTVAAETNGKKQNAPSNTVSAKKEATGTVDAAGTSKTLNRRQRRQMGLHSKGATKADSEDS